MRIGIVSDSHGRRLAVSLALAELRERGVTTVLHCGDIDKEALRSAIADIGGTLHDHFGSVDLEGVKIAFLHGDDQRMMRDVERSGYYDFLFYGHTHQAEEHRSGPTRVINPGALHRARPKTFLVLDLESREVESVAIE